MDPMRSDISPTATSDRCDRSSSRSRPSPIGRLTQVVRRLLGAIAAAVIGAGSLSVTARPAGAIEPAQAAQGPPLNVAVLVSNRSDLCYDPGDVAAIKRFTLIEQERLNGIGGVAGRPLQVRFLDDNRDPQRTADNVRSALADPQMLAIIGLANSSRAQSTFKTLGAELDRTGIPFISDLAVNSIFAPHTNVFTTRSSQDTERVPVIAAFIKSMGFARPVFVGIDGMLFSAMLGDGVKKALGEAPLAADHRLKLVEDKFDPATVSETIADIGAKGTDLLLLSVGNVRTGPILKQMIASGTTPPVMLSGRIDALPPDVVKAYPNDLYQLAWDNLPEVYNDRLRRLIGNDAPENWIFEGRKQRAAPGWSKGECKDRPDQVVPDALSAANLRAIGIGTQYADMIGLVTAAASTAGRGATIAAYREHLAAGLKTTYATGRGLYKGAFENWSFDPDSRSASRTPFVVMQPRGLGRTQLAPIQYVRLKDGALRPTNTLYLDIDMVRAHHVDDNEKTFFAEFYLSMRDRNNEASIDQLEFTNGFLDPRTNGRQISVGVLHDGKPNEAYPNDMKIYKVTGRFLYDPDLTSYPFDTQRFSIDVQPKRGDAPFIVQPPPDHLRDKNIATDGWESKQQFVSYDEDFVPVIDPYSHAPSVVPFYKASYVWQMKRQTTDYFLRVVVPLAFILIVAYLSIFIPQSHFEAIVTIQVTALLSAVALYLSLPKLDTDTATLSDRIFVFDYLLVSMMIVISILMVNRRVSERPWLKRALAAFHVIVIPMMVLGMAGYLYMLGTSDG